MFTSARAETCISHNTCLRRPQRQPTLGPASATSPVYICRPQYLFTLARVVTCIGHNMCLCRPQHLFTSANTGTCVGHIIVPATGQWHSRDPGNPTGSAQCAGPGNGSSRHSVMALCDFFFISFVFLTNIWICTVVLRNREVDDDEKGPK